MAGKSSMYRANAPPTDPHWGLLRFVRIADLVASRFVGYAFLPFEKRMVSLAERKRWGVLRWWSSKYQFCFCILAEDNYLPKDTFYLWHSALLILLEDPSNLAYTPQSQTNACSFRALSFVLISLRLSYFTQTKTMTPKLLSILRYSCKWPFGY